jgi:hypothetical protein
MSKDVKAECKHGAQCKHLALGKCKFTHAVSGAKTVGKAPMKSPKVALTQHAVLLMARSVAKRRVAFEGAVSAAKPLPPRGWAMVTDEKSPAPNDYVASLCELYKAELSTAKAALASCYGTKPVKFMCTGFKFFQSTVTTGLVSTPNIILLTDLLEYASLIELFDEYRFVSAKYRFHVPCPTPTLVLATSTFDPQLVIGFDPADATALTSVALGTQLQYHKLIGARTIATPATGTYVGVFGRADNEPYELEWHYRNDEAVTGNGGVVAPGMWKSTQGNINTFPDGTLKPFYLSGETTVKVCVTGILYAMVEFRART